MEKEERVFINIYKDDQGDRYISNHDFETYDKAFKLRDKVSTYIETVEIIRPIKHISNGE